jgi:hypothetical protein
LTNVIAASAIGGEVLYLADATSGLPAANAKIISALFVAKPEGVTPWVRTGQSLLGKKVKSLRIFKLVGGSSGQGHGEWSTAGIRFIVGFTDGTQAIVRATAPGAYEVLASSGTPVEDPACPAARWKGFGAAVNSSSAGDVFAFLARIDSGSGVIPEVIRPGIFVGTSGVITSLASFNDLAPAGAAGKFKAFSGPVLASDGSCVAFVATTNSGPAAIPGIFAKYGEEPLGTVTTMSAVPPGTESGVQWKSFTSLAAPGGGLGPLFTATLRGSGIDGTNDAGLWVVDSSGTLRCLFRKGDLISGSTIKSIGILKAVPASSGVTRAFNGSTQIVWQANFTDLSSAIISTVAP